MYEIIETYRGKQTLKIVDTLPICRRRLVELRNSRPKASFIMQKSTATVKFEAKPIKNFAPSGSGRGGPRVVR